MSFELVRGDGGASERMLRFTPKIDSFKDNKLKLKFEFENPLYVSTGDEDDLMVA